MKASLKNCSSLNKFSCFTNCKYLLVLAVCLIAIKNKAQVINYVNNPGFEIELPSATITPYDAVKFWGPIDTAQAATYLQSTYGPFGLVPYCMAGFQYPRTGNNFIMTDFFNPNSIRWYPRNRLKQVLKPNTAYCAKYYVVNTNSCTVGIENYGAYFGNGTLDTITDCSSPLTYLNPQVQYQNGIITDTLKWTVVTGTFVAIGDEKYMVLGNFKSNATTNTLVINPINLPTLWSECYIDDVSLIELNLPAYAGSDVYLIPGDSAFIGRQPDVGIDEACTWYQLPDMTTAIDTVAGLWVKPVTTSTYVVKQDICGMIKWDTVIIYKSAVGINEQIFKAQSLKIYPVPVQDELYLQFDVDGMDKEFMKAEILSSTGQLLKEIILNYNDKKASVNIKDLPEGLYLLNFKSNNSGIVSKRFIVNR